MSTPVVINGVAYEHLKSQRMLAIEVETGRELWTASEGFGKYLSLVAQGDRILALDQRGLLYLLRANPKQFEMLDKRRLNDSEILGPSRRRGEELFVRELNAPRRLPLEGTRKPREPRECGFAFGCGSELKKPPNR